MRRPDTAASLDPSGLAAFLADRDGPFHDRVFTATRLVPPGRVTTYGDVGSVLGGPRLARQVGWALAALPPGSDVPWHRVINAQAAISYRGDLARATEQLRRLEEEGVLFEADGRCALATLRWDYPQVERISPSRR